MKLWLLLVSILLLIGCLLLVVSRFLEWKKIGPLWLQGLWAKYATLTEAGWTYSKPYLKKFLGGTWSGLKWLKDHRKEKRVWVSALVSVASCLLLLGVISAAQIIGGIRHGLGEGATRINFPGTTWIFIAVLGFFFILLEVAAWVLVWQGTRLKSKTLWKIHAWVAVGIGTILLIGSLVLIPWGKGVSAAKNLTGGAFDWYSKTVPYPWVVIGLISLIILWMIIRKKGSAATAKSGHGGEKEGGIAFGLSLIAIIVVGLLAFKAGTERGEERTVERAKTEPREFAILVTPHEEYPVELPLHMSFTADFLDPNRKVWMRLEGQPRFLYKSGDPDRKMDLQGKRFVYFQSADGKALVMEIKIKPDTESQRQ